MVADAARAGTAAALALLAMAVLSWTPVQASPVVALPGLPLAGLAVVLAVLASLMSRERCLDPRRVRLVVSVLGLFGCGLALVVASRPAAGLPLVVSEGEAERGRRPPGPIDVAGRDLGDLPRIRAWRLHWEGELRVPATGVYRLWAEGRGRLEVTIDGRLVLAGDGERLRALSEQALPAGPHVLSVRLARDGPGPRLRLGWVRPGADGRASGRSEVIPARHLGEPTAAAWWWLTDALAAGLGLSVGALVLVLPWDARRRLSVPGPMTRAEVSVSVAAYAALLALMSWPLVTDLAHLGVMDRPDGRLNAWILAWDAHGLLASPGRVFQAPIFHPLPDALAFSENLLLPGLLSAPAQAAFGPVLAYNLVLLASLLASGLGAQALVRRAAGDRLAAFAAGALFAAGAHRWIRLAHLHAQVTVFLPVALWALDRFWERRTLRRAALVGGCLALQGLSSVYLGAITAAALGTGLVLMAFAGLRARELVTLLAGLGIGGLLLLPVALPYLRMRAFQGVEFTLEDVALYATTIESYAASGTPLYGGLTQRHLDPERVQDTLFPGLVVLGLGLAGLASAPRRYAAFAAAASLVAVVLSLGPETAVYRWLHEHVVLVRGVRALSRFSLIPVLSLCVLAGVALAGRRFHAVLLALALGLLESSHAPLRLGRYDGPPAEARFLAGRPGAVAYLPLGERDTEAMLDATAHWRPLVNGDSGFVPRPYTRAMEALEAPLGEEGRRLLRGLGVRDVVTADPEGLVEVARFGSTVVAEVPAGEPARAVGPGTPVATVWQSEGIVLDLAETRMVDEVVFVADERPWLERPSVEASLDGRTFTPLEARASLGDAVVSLMTDPRGGRGAVRMPPTRARFLRLDRRLPARPGALEVRP
jgi:hypothetical protein